MIDSHPLQIVTLKVLEEWAMMLVDPVEATPALFDPEKKLIMSWVSVHGVINGAVSIVAQEGFLRTLAANLLGSDDGEVPDNQLQDAFKEMGNVLTGNFLTEAYGDDTVFDLLDTNVSEIKFEELRRFMDRKVVYAFCADDSPVAVTFSMGE